MIYIAFESLYSTLSSNIHSYFLQNADQGNEKGVHYSYLTGRAEGQPLLFTNPSGDEAGLKATVSV